MNSFHFRSGRPPPPRPVCRGRPDWLLSIFCVVSVPSVVLNIMRNQFKPSTRHPSQEMCRFHYFLSHGSAFAGRGCGLCKCSEIFTSQLPQPCFIQKVPRILLVMFVCLLPSGFDWLLTLQLLLEMTAPSGRRRRSSEQEVSAALFSSGMDGRLRLYSTTSSVVFPLLSQFACSPYRSLWVCRVGGETRGLDLTCSV